MALANYPIEIEEVARWGRGEMVAAWAVGNGMTGGIGQVHRG